MLSERSLKLFGSSALLPAARRGDARALTALVQQHEKRVYALVGRMLVGRPDRLDDVAQDVLVKVLAGLPRFDPAGPAKLSTWILTIATRTCIDVLRRPSRAQPLDFDPPQDACLERTVEQRDLYRKVTRAMAALAPEQRAALVLRAYHDLNTAEIAEVLGVEAGTVKSRLSRARAALKTALGNSTGEQQESSARGGLTP